MLSSIAALACGLIFGLGLILSGMGNPAKVQNFLDFFGQWDPSLALVMGGAIAIGLIAFAWAQTRSTALLGEPMQLPGNTAIDKKLLTGSALFGVGWGLAGFCPGPALMNLATLQAEVWIFVAAMLAGMVLQHAWAARSEGRKQ
ncbi:YeeE/YedE family protein [Comamonas fluminis]|uniref:YeeE/YedE family protein n=1 Tax=Comamonas fluminis TaxID=2796366 RepID=UPI001C450533|nr:YeeE/YedE family protein [Comamonas fluminis]